MFVEERHNEILRILKEDNKVLVKDLSKKFQVTQDCIRKDLVQMEKQGLLKRTYGGAVTKDGVSTHNPYVSKRKGKNQKEKIRIAKAAVKLIEEGNMVFLDTSTTNIELAKEIVANDLKITVVSCMLDIAQVFAGAKATKFLLLGGEFNRTQNGFLGSLTMEMIKSFRFDKAFIGVVAADVTANEVMTYVPSDGLLKQEVMKRSYETNFVMEIEKFEFHANYVFATLEEIDHIICEDKPSKKIIDRLKKKNVSCVYN